METLHYGESFFTVEKVILRPLRVYLLNLLCQESLHHQALHNGGGQGQVQGGELEGDLQDIPGKGEAHSEEQINLKRLILFFFYFLLFQRN